MRTAAAILVGEGPGKDEDETGEAFVGKSGQLLRGILEEEFTDVVFEYLFITNIIQCRPPRNRDPKPDEIEACSPWLKYKLTRSPAKVVVCIGKPASRTLIGPDYEWGKWVRKDGMLYISTYHPSYIIRNPKNKEAHEKFKKWLFEGIRAGVRETLEKK
jgi:DNA polymerase